MAHTLGRRLVEVGGRAPATSASSAPCAAALATATLSGASCVPIRIDFYAGLLEPPAGARACGTAGGRRQAGRTRPSGTRHAAARRKAPRRLAAPGEGDVARLRVRDEVVSAERPWPGACERPQRSRRRRRGGRPTMVPVCRSTRRARRRRRTRDRPRLRGSSAT